MSISDIDLVIERIKVATKHSPIAVLKAPDKKLKAVFYTEKTKYEIKMIPDNFIGVYDKNMDLEDVESDILKSIERK